MGDILRDQQIERLLLNAHIERQEGVDLIEEYFERANSLDEITEIAKKLIDEHSDVNLREMIAKNLSECVVVKSQKTRSGFVSKFLGKLGINFKGSDIGRAERLIQQFWPVSARFPSKNASSDE